MPSIHARNFIGLKFVNHRLYPRGWIKAIGIGHQNIFSWCQLLAKLPGRATTLNTLEKRFDFKFRKHFLRAVFWIIVHYNYLSGMGVTFCESEKSVLTIFNSSFQTGITMETTGVSFLLSRINPSFILSKNGWGISSKAECPLICSVTQSGFWKRFTIMIFKKSCWLGSVNLG